MTRISHTHFSIWLSYTFALPNLLKMTILTLQFTQTMWFWPRTRLWDCQNQWKASLLQKGSKVGG